MSFMHTVLATKRLVLRRVTARDIDVLVELHSDPAVMRFLSVPKPRAEVEAVMRSRYLALHERHPGFGYWAAEERQRPEAIGLFALRPVTPGTDWIDNWPDAPPGQVTVAELGYRLRLSAWGHGYATEGARALVDHAFAALGVTRVVATTMAVNTRSRQVMENVGLRYTRTLHLTWTDPLPGNEHGDVEYELTRDDWTRLSLPGTPAPR
jgi:RimJ/RimL family protein N-acetyltransferase